jgi:hypothetical protein
MITILFFASVALIVGVVIVSRNREKLREEVLPPVNLAVESPGFEPDGEIPKRHSGYGEDLSPALSWSEVDGAAVSIAIIMDDLDHPMGIFNHWVIWNIPATWNELPEGIGRGAVLEAFPDVIQGKSAYGGKHYYRGPKPPLGSHRYRFQVFVLNKALAIPKDSTKADVINAMQGQILQYGELIGVFDSASRSKE